MRWSEIPWQPPSSTLRWFAAIWLLWFAGLGSFVWVFRDNETAGIILLSAALLIGSTGLIRPQAIRPVFVGSMVVTFPIGWLISRLLLAVVFYCLFMPLGLFFRLSGRDTLGRKIKSELASYWSMKSEPSSIGEYFHQS